MSRYWPHLLVLLVALAVSVASVGFDFVVYDDDYLVYRNKTIQDLENLPEFFDPTADRTDMGPEYLPLATTSLALDHALFGLRPAGFHSTNVVLYALGCVLLLLVLLRLFENRHAALFGALVFAVHPIHTESFAWVSERKTLLNAVFVLLSLWGYIRFRNLQSYRWYAFALATFVLAFMSKYTAASFPLALVAYDLSLGSRPGRSLASTFLPCLPFFAVSAAMTWIAMDVASRYQIVKPVEGHFMSQLANDPVIVLHYLRLLFLPVEQCAYYLWPLASGFSLSGAVGYLVILLLVAAFWGLRHRAPAIGFACAWFLILLLPVLNFVPKGLWVAERYLFLPSIALSLAAAWLVTWFGRRFGTPDRRRALVAAGVVVISVLGSACVMRSFVWSDSVSLWEDTLSHPLGNPTAYDQLGVYYLTVARQPGKAERVFEAGLREMDIRKTPASGLALRMRFHRILCCLMVSDEERARNEWLELGELLARQRDPGVTTEYSRWRDDLARLSPRVVE